MQPLARFARLAAQTTAQHAALQSTGDIIVIAVSDMMKACSLSVKCSLLAPHASLVPTNNVTVLPATACGLAAQ
jgi:hypothetical protein